MTKRITLAAYIKQLQELQKKYPNAKLIYAHDEEGNGYEEIIFTPTPGVFTDGDFQK